MLSIIVYSMDFFVCRKRIAVLRNSIRISAHGAGDQRPLLLRTMETQRVQLQPTVPQHPLHFVLGIHHGQVQRPQKRRRQPRQNQNLLPGKHPNSWQEMQRIKKAKASSFLPHHVHEKRKKNLAWKMQKLIVEAFFLLLPQWRKCWCTREHLSCLETTWRLLIHETPHYIVRRSAVWVGKGINQFPCGREGIALAAAAVIVLLYRTRFSHVQKRRIEREKKENAFTLNSCRSSNFQNFKVYLTNWQSARLRRERERDWTELQTIPFHSVILGCRSFFQNLQFEFIKEEVGYGTIDLLCDIGGTLSLLMGASLLTCCELVEVAWCAVVNKCYTGNKKIVKRLSTRRKNHPRKRRPKKSMAAAAASTPSSVEIRRRLSRNSDENNGAGGGNNREPV